MRCGLSKSHYQIPEVLVSHRSARLTFQGRLLLVQRVRVEGWAVAHAAKAMGVSRKCAHYWLKRYDEEGEVDTRQPTTRRENRSITNAT